MSKLKYMKVLIDLSAVPRPILDGHHIAKVIEEFLLPEYRAIIYVRSTGRPQVIYSVSKSKTVCSSKSAPWKMQEYNTIPAQFVLCAPKFVFNLAKAKAYKGAIK